MTQLKANATEDFGKVIYTAKTHTIGGRENGVSRISDGRLDVKISPPGSSRIGTNPEQLFAAGWMSRLRPQARRVSAPIQNSFLRLAGRHASKARSGSPLASAG